MMAHRESSPSAFLYDAQRPADMTLTAIDVFAAEGRGGSTRSELARLESPSGSTLLLIAIVPSLVAADIPRVRERLDKLITDLRSRAIALERSRLIVPAIATVTAHPSIIAACDTEQLGLFDSRGTIILRAPSLYVNIQIAKGEHARPKAARDLTLFRGKTARVIRVLLQNPNLTYTTRTLAGEADTSFGLTLRVLNRLEAEGSVRRKSPKSGYRLVQPERLLRSWIESGESTAVETLRFYAPSTAHALLSRVTQALQGTGMRSVFTLASGLLPDEAHVAALPHGIYLSGSIEPVREALGLKETTPHNFFILRAHPTSMSEHGGIFSGTRSLPWGAGVSLPQLAVDCAGVAGRGRDQAMRLLELFADGRAYEADE
jgi:hypothetical protein